MFGIKQEDTTQSNTFAGVRFILLGFDPLSEQKVGLKLVNGGGVDVGSYGPDCTHVIVDKLVYDDPICVSARRDKKVLVTGLWVDHSFDLGMPVDPTSVMYVPLKGRDGIPGAKSLIVCLTGYQRQDRTDIMTMVGLMGANFSKPLVANKVTHLICYKFEGEKYDLAWKMKRIKLVNHRWLEDCLKAWEILPEDDYNKSGYELEMMDAEAKDSEDDGAAQKPVVKQIEEMKTVASPKPMIVRPRVSPRSKDNFSHTPPASSASKGFLNVSNTDVTGKESTSAKNSDIEEFDKTTDAVGHHDPLNQTVTCDEPYAKSPTSVNVGSNQAANYSVAKFNSMSYSRKLSSNLSSYSKVDVDKFDTSDGFDNPFLREQSKFETQTGPVRSPKEEGTLFCGKRRLDISYGKSKSPKINLDSKTCGSGSPSVSNLVTKPSVAALPNNAGVDKIASPSSTYTSPVNTANASPCPGYISPVIMAKEILYDAEPKSLSKSVLKLDRPQLSSTEPENINYVIGEGDDASIEAVKTQVKEKNAQAPSPEAKFLGIDKSNSSNLDTCEGKNSDSLGKKSRKKTVAKRTLDSVPRRKLGLGKAKNQKGSIYLNEVVSLSTAGNNSCEKVQQLPSDVNVDRAMNVEMNIVEPVGKEYVDTTYMDDETEAPEDKEEDEIQAISGGEKAEETNEGNLATKDRLECTIPSTAKTDDRSDPPFVDEGAAKYENELSRKKNGFDEPVIEKGGELEKSTKSLGKTKSVSTASGKRISRVGVGREESESKKNNQKLGLNKEKSSPSLTNTPERTVYLEKTDNAEKGNIPVDKRKSIPLVSGKRKSKGESRVESENKKIKEMSSPTVAERTSFLEKAEKSTVAEKENSPIDKRKSVPLVSGKRTSKEGESSKESETRQNNLKMGLNKEKSRPVPTAKIKSTPPGKSEGSAEVEKENRPAGIGDPNVGQRIAKAASGFKKTPAKIGSKAGIADHGSILGALNMENEPTCFILTGHRFQRKEFQQVIKHLRGRVCRDSHHKWSYQATHLIYPEPLRRTEKFFAAAASGRWILKTDYLAACNQAGSFVAEEPYEWHNKCLSEDGAINLEAPRKWRHLRERTGHGALYGMRVVIYGECIAPSLETLKRVIKAGDGTVLATSPPYTRFLDSGIDYAIVSPGMPRVDIWIQEFISNKIPCVVADYLVEYVCKPGYPLDKHVQYNTQAWAENSFANLQSRLEEVVIEKGTSEDDVTDDIPCGVCGSTERGEVMLICGDESGSFGCGVGTHIDCCYPPLERVPDEDWFCSKCEESKKKSKGYSRSTKKGRSLLKRK